MRFVIHIEKILVYYDTIQVFIGADNVHTKYLCLLVSCEETDRYLGIRISSNRLAELLAANIDLRTAFINSEISKEFFIFESAGMDFSIIETIEDVSEEMLPEEGFFFPDMPEEKTIISEMLRFNKPVIHLGLIDKNNSHDIKVETLSTVLDNYQSLVTNIHRKIWQNKKKEIRTEDHTLNIFTSSAASFNLHMYVAAQLDLFGKADIDETLNVIDSIFSFKDEQDLTEKLSPIKGHAISHYKNLLRDLLDNGLTIKYKWTGPSIGKNIVKYTKVSDLKINQAYDILMRSTEMEREFCSFAGFFKKVDSTNGDWKFYDTELKKEVKGKSYNLDLMSGITIITKEYQIKCEEKAEKQNITDKLTKTLYIEQIKHID